MTVNIPLDENFSIGADSRQWFLNEKSCNSTYYQDLESLIKSYFNRKVWASDCQSVQELISFYKMLVKACSVALAPLNIKVEGENAGVRSLHIKKTISGQNSFVKKSKNDIQEESSGGQNGN